MRNSSADPGDPSPAPTSWWRKKNFGRRALDAFKTALAAVICLELGNLLGLERSYWAAISAIVVMTFDSTTTVASCRDRLIGTSIGALLGWATCYAWRGHYLLYGVAVALCVFVCSALAFDKAGRLAAVTLSVIVLVKFDGGPAHAAISRFCEVGLGILVALAVTMLVFPARSAQTSEAPNQPPPKG